MSSLSTIDIFFYIFATAASLLALRVVTAKSPISSAFSLVIAFFFVAGIYVLMEAHFIAAIQILVYAGAVMVLFVFVIMLLNADLKTADFVKGKAVQAGSAIFAIVLFCLFVHLLKKGEITTVRGVFTTEKIQELGGNSQVLSQVLFSDYILPFELTSVLLLVGIFGSVALAKRAKTKRQLGVK